MLTDKELNQIRAIVRTEIDMAFIALSRATLKSAPHVVGAMCDCGQTLMNEKLEVNNANTISDPIEKIIDENELRARIDRMIGIDRRNDERIATWQAGKEGAGE